MRIFVTSDTHFLHANIIEYCRRPFSSVEEMDETLARNWNSVVSDEDLVIHMGDLTIKRRSNELTERATTLLLGLRGKKLLIRGNHDKKGMVAWLRHHGWHVFDSISVRKELLLTHRPYTTVSSVRIPTKTHRVLLHGHAHGTMGMNTSVRIDCGVDALEGYRPHLLETLLPKHTVEQLREQLVRLHVVK